MFTIPDAVRLNPGAVMSLFRSAGAQLENTPCDRFHFQRTASSRCKSVVRVKLGGSNPVSAQVKAALGGGGVRLALNIKRFAAGLVGLGGVPAPPPAEPEEPGLDPPRLSGRERKLL